MELRVEIEKAVEKDLKELGEKYGIEILENPSATLGLKASHLVDSWDEICR